jgi:hypothetical protein
MERDEKIVPQVVDYEIALAMLADLSGREAWSTSRVLVQWVATIRKYERMICLAEEAESRRVIG